MAPQVGLESTIKRNINDMQGPEESDLAEGVQCPLHGKRFTPRFHLYVAAWRWENEVKFRWPTLSVQYHKAWAASVPPDLSKSWQRQTIESHRSL
jgi:hypothetical protein